MNNPVTNSRICLSFTNPPAVGDTFTHVSSTGNERWWKIHQLTNNKIIAHSLDVDFAGRPLFTETYYYGHNNPLTLGTIIHATMQEGDMIPALLRVVMNHNPEAFREIVGLSPIPPYAMKDARDPWWRTDSALCILEDTADALSAMAPAGTYFGSHPGDSSDLGFWTLEH